MVETTRVSAELRTLVVERARDRCEYCLSPARYATQRFSVEHVLPRTRGGQTVLENLALACQGCNNHKYNHTETVDPVSGLIVPLYNPRRDYWAALLLNRAGVANLRRLLLLVGEHPPTIPEL